MTDYPLLLQQTCGFVTQVISSTRLRLVRQLKLSCLLVLLFCFNTTLTADEARARAAMSNPQNNLVAVFTSKGAFYIELFNKQAPRTVAHFIALVSGTMNFPSSDLQIRYYDQSSFHTVIPGRALYAGSPSESRFGLQPPSIPTEIDGVALGLDTRPLLDSTGEVDQSFAILTRKDFEQQILAPLYEAAGIESAQALSNNAEQMMQRLQQLSVLDALSNLGHHFSSGLDTQPIIQGTVALLPTTPGEVGAEFVISMMPSPWLDGRATPIGNVVDGLSVINEIGSIKVSPDDDPSLATTIYSMRIL
jgi:cyclophilin family peptidyl-prolyl cis-trans isomerase